MKPGGFKLGPGGFKPTGFNLYKPHREDDGEHGGGEDLVPPLLPLLKVGLVVLVLQDVAVQVGI